MTILRVAKPHIRDQATKTKNETKKYVAEILSADKLFTSISFGLEKMVAITSRQIKNAQPKLRTKNANSDCCDTTSSILHTKSMLKRVCVFTKKTHTFSVIQYEVVSQNHCITDIARLQEKSKQAGAFMRPPDVESIFNYSTITPPFGSMARTWHAPSPRVASIAVLKETSISFGTNA